MRLKTKGCQLLEEQKEKRNPTQDSNIHVYCKEEGIKQLNTETSQRDLSKPRDGGYV
ncbi:rCG47641 [Rattus norvegicus]|uniref:RCG47641 n=1 Tax=Rattus norvegicus TaxID=10116 RepID=A6I0L7_RAT|nr:rCG47641 [Rattus norvegicus]